jgi:hypothetical protein
MKLTQTALRPMDAPPTRPEPETNIHNNNGLSDRLSGM